MFRGFWRHGLTALAMAGLAACSPYTHAEAVARFGGAVAGLSQSARDATIRLEADRVGLIRTRLSQRVIDRVVIPDCDRRDLAACAMRPSPAADVPDAVQLTAADTRLLRILQRYAASLQALVRIEDRAAFDAQGQALASEAGAAAAMAQPGAGAIVQPVVEAVAWSVGQGLDWRRLRALRASTAEAQPVLEQQQQPMADMLSRLRQAREAVLRRHIADLSAAMGRAASEAARLRLFDELANRRTVLLEVLAGSPLEAARALVDAHRKLRDSLADGAPTAAQVLEAVDGFVEQAQAIRNGLSRP